MRWIRELLCRVGIHDWAYWCQHDGEGHLIQVGIEFVDRRLCKLCNASQSYSYCQGTGNPRHGGDGGWFWVKATRQVSKAKVVR